MLVLLYNLLNLGVKLLALLAKIICRLVRHYLERDWLGGAEQLAVQWWPWRRSCRRWRLMVTSIAALPCALLHGHLCCLDQELRASPMFPSTTSSPACDGSGDYCLCASPLCPLRAVWYYGIRLSLGYSVVQLSTWWCRRTQWSFWQNGRSYQYGVLAAGCPIL